VSSPALLLFDPCRFCVSHPEVKLKVIKRWCVQVLEGLRYLHAQSPPIIHRDIKCENLLYNAATGSITIGDLGLATQQTVDVARLDATPNFMAPEMFEGKYDETIDVYAFGLCVLEMVTRRVPYDECANMVQIFNKVTRVRSCAWCCVTDRGFFSDGARWCRRRRRRRRRRRMCSPSRTRAHARTRTHCCTVCARSLCVTMMCVAGVATGHRTGVS
jgi:serine/threonine protein kinase